MTDHSALIERLEAMGRSHRAHESGLRKRLAAGDRSLSVQDPDNAARSAETCEKVSAALRDQQARIEDAEKATRWAYKALERYDDALGLNTDEAALVALYLCKDFCEGRPSITHPLPSAPNQAKEAGE